MKVKLFKELENGPEIEINSAYEEGVVYHFLISCYGSMYKELLINDVHLVRLETHRYGSEGKYALIDGDKTIEYTYDQMKAGRELHEQLEGADISYKDYGNYSALEFKGNLYTTVNVDGYNQSAMFPTEIFDTLTAKDSSKLYCAGRCCPDIIAANWDEANNEWYIIRLRFGKSMERDIIYNMNINNPIYNYAEEA